MDSTTAIRVEDRIALFRSILMPFPGPAETPHREQFARVLDEYGVPRVFGYLWRRGIAHAVAAGHEWHPAVRDEDGPFRRLARVSRAIAGLHRIEMARIADAFTGAGVPLLAYKGLALDLALGNTLTPSFSHDMDFLVRRDGLADATKIFESLGYGSRLLLDGDRVRRTPARLVRMTEEGIYSFGQCQPLDMLVAAPDLESIAGPAQQLLPGIFCTISGRLHVKMSVDLHYTLNLLSDDIGTRVKPAETVWWHDTQPVPIGDGSLRTVSDQVLSWALPHRLYVDTMLLQQPSIKPLCHMKLLWHHDRFDVPHIHETARRFPYLAPSLHYALRALDVLGGLGLDALTDPRELRGVTAPTMNLGDCLPAMLDVGFAFELDGERLSARYF